MRLRQRLMPGVAFVRLGREAHLDLPDPIDQRNGRRHGARIERPDAEKETGHNADDEIGHGAFGSPPAPATNRSAKRVAGTIKTQVKSMTCAIMRRWQSSAAARRFVHLENISAGFSAAKTHQDDENARRQKARQNFIDIENAARKLLPDDHRHGAGKHPRQRTVACHPSPEQ